MYSNIEKFLILLITGYFGIKIFYGIFGKYSKKPVRNEMVDFSVMIVMGSILYVLTNIDKRHILDTTLLFFLAGYIIGLNFAFVYQEVYSNEDIMSNKFLQYLFLGVFITIILIMLYLSILSANANSNNGIGGPLYYVLYLIVIAVLIGGIIMTRKKPLLFGATKYDDNMQNIFGQLTKYFNSEDLIKMIDDDNFRTAIKTAIKTGDTNQLVKIVTSYFSNFPQMQDKQHIIDLLLSLNKPISENGYINTGGTYIYFGLAMIGWLLSLLFVYNGGDNMIQKLLTIANGFTIGMFVSGVSFYGFPYLLEDRKEEQCFGEDECAKKKMIMKNTEYEDVRSTLTTLKWGMSFTIIILIVSIMLFYTMR